MKRLLMAEGWNLFASVAFPKNCSAIQRKEMRRAFYAGANALLSIIITHLLGDSAANEGDQERLMKSIDDELREFASEVMKGRA